MKNLTTVLLARRNVWLGRGEKEKMTEGGGRMSAQKYGIQLKYRSIEVWFFFLFFLIGM